MSDVFISYSRKDKEFVHKLNDTLKASDRESWVDWEKIRTADDWWRKIQEAIAAANTFVFVITPDSIASKICRKEVDYASSLNKRIMPILRKELTKDLFSTMTHDHALRAYNWLYFQESDNFDEAFGNLLLAIDSDYEHADAHTRLLLKAIEWDGKPKESFLLRGELLEAAEKWLVAGKDKEPKPTPMQIAFIESSRKAENVRRKTSRQIKLGLGAALLVVLVTGALAINAMMIANENRRAQIEEGVNQAEKAFQRNDQISAIIESIKTLSLITSFKETDSKFPLEKLYEIILNTQERNRLEFKESLEGLDIHPNGQVFVSGGNDKTIRLWNIDGTLLDKQIQNANVKRIKFSRDGKILASVNDTNQISLWQIQNGKLFKIEPNIINGLQLSSQKNYKIRQVWDLEFSPNNEFIAFSSIDGWLVLWSKHTSPKIISCKTKKAIYGISFHSNKNTIAFGCNEGVYVWGTNQSAIPQLIPNSNAGDENIITSVKFNNDGTKLASATSNGVIRLYDTINQFRLLGEMRIVNSPYLLKISFDPTNNFIASAYRDPNVGVKIWSVEKAISYYPKYLDQPERNNLIGHTKALNNIIFNPKDQSILISSSYDSTIRIWSLKKDSISKQNMSAVNLLEYSCNLIENYIRNSDIYNNLQHIKIICLKKSSFNK